MINERTVMTCVLKLSGGRRGSLGSLTENRLIGLERDRCIIKIIYKTALRVRLTWDQGIAL
jgi:hypothetical protein